MVLSNKIFTMSDYLELVAKCGDITNEGRKDLPFIHGVLYYYNLSFKDYALSDITAISNNDLNVILVDCLIRNGNNIEHDYRWFEVPSDITVEEIKHCIAKTSKKSVISSFDTYNQKPEIATNLSALFTFKKSKIFYSKYGVGKQMGSKIYVHINYWEQLLLPKDMLDNIQIALSIAKSKIDKDMFSLINLMCIDLSQPEIIRLDYSPNFDTAYCPYVYLMYFIDITTDRSEKVPVKYNGQILHHKWLWVKEDYKGFDVIKSWEFSRLWLSKFREPASGYEWKWNEQLSKYGLSEYKTLD